MARFDWKAKLTKKGARVKLTDRSGKTVAKGKGKTIAEAQESAIDKAKNEDAKLFLQQVKFPERSTTAPPKPRRRPRR
jgi:hypothetical protein